MRQPRSQVLHDALRNFCLGSFFALADELDGGADMPVALAEHGGASRPTLYEYRPLVGTFVEERADWLGMREDALAALAPLKDEPAAGIFARAHESAHAGEDEALRRTILLPLLVRVTERCGGFDWDDQAFESAYFELEQLLFGAARSYAAITPLVGATAGAELELGTGIRVRRADAGELAGQWPESAGLWPEDFMREWDRTLVLELDAELSASAPEVPDAPLLFARAVSVLRLATPGALAAGPPVFQRLDGRPYDIARMPALAAQCPEGEPARIDAFRGRLASSLFERLGDGDLEPDVLEAVERYEIALFNRGPLRADELREALVLLLGSEDGSWAAAMRAAALVGETPDERAELLSALRPLVEGDGAGARSEDVVRRAIVESILADSRDSLVSSIDEALLGVRPRVPLADAARAARIG